MPYKTLYRRRQQADADYVPREWYLADALELSWVDGITLKASARLDRTRVRGMVISHGPNFIQNLTANYTIIVAEGMTREFERLVVIKELMHCYFGPDGGFFTDSAISLDSHMRSFFGNSFTIRSLPAEAEAKALWMALGVLCPENRRLHFRDRVLNPNDSMTYEEVAGILHIPVHAAKAILSKQFEDEIAHILK